MEADELLARQWTSSPLEIYRILRQTMDRRTLITVSLPDGHRKFTSVILRIPPELNQLIIDEPQGADAPSSLQQRAPIKIIINGPHGSTVSFNTALQEIGQDRGKPHWSLAFPDEVRRQHRRSHYRVPLGKILRIKASIPLAVDNTLRAELEDISVHGLSLRCTERSLLQLSQHTRIKDCRIELPTGVLHCMIQVQHAKPGSRHGSYMLGARFVHLTPLQQRQLERTIAQLQREVIRSQRRTRYPHHISAITA